MSKWNPGLFQLVNLLSSLYFSYPAARTVAAIVETGLDPEWINLARSSKEIWHDIVAQANAQGRIPDLLRVAKSDFPGSNVDWDTLGKLVAQRVASSPELREWHHSVDDSTLEAITGKEPTFLPISFLEAGLRCSRSVVRIQARRALGTGFLTRDNLLITNNHVICSPEVALETKIWFNYQPPAEGDIAEVEEYELDPKSYFETSPVIAGDDWTVVRVKGSANVKWGALDIENIGVAVNDFVNIIQHPGGLPKQIAIYHNVVMYTGSSRIQYLTDTLPGSSGSPVFDSQWRVVALHHSGGWLAEPGSRRVAFRNEGISSRVLAAALKRAH